MAEKLCELRKKGGGNINFNNAVVGTFTPSTSQTTKVTLGFKPKLVVTFGWHGPTMYNAICCICTADGGYQQSLSETYPDVNVFTSYTIPYTGNNRINSLDNNGFTMGKVSTAKRITYFAI